MKRLSGYILLSCFAILIAFIIIKQYRLKHNYEVTNATITETAIRMDKNGFWLIEYEFETKSGTKLQGSTFVPLFISKKDKLVGRIIPCTYYKNNETTSQLLIYKHTWKQYGLPYPDSMKWVGEFIDASKIIYSY